MTASGVEWPGESEVNYEAGQASWSVVGTTLAARSLENARGVAEGDVLSSGRSRRHSRRQLLTALERASSRVEFTFLRESFRRR